MALKSCMKRVVVFISGLVLCLFLCVGTASAAAFQNGSFELGTTTYPFVNVGMGNTNITGWAVTAGNVDFIDDYWTAQNGTRSIDLNGNQPGTIAQTFDTISGHPYQVEFWLAANPNGSTFKTVEVGTTGVGNIPQQFTFDITGHSNNNMGWDQHFYSFLADASSTTLTFASLSLSAYGPALDAVSVTDTYTGPGPIGTPEPATLLLLSLGLVGLAGVRRKFNK